MAVPEYMILLDAGEVEKALGCMEPDVTFLLALPTGPVTGTSRADFAAYIAGRGAGARVHNVLRHTVAGDLEVVYGIVTESGMRTGSFLAAAVLSPRGRMRRYQSYFDPGFSLFDWPERTPS